jgi:hypothetical protein
MADETQAPQVAMGPPDPGQLAGLAQEHPQIPILAPQEPHPQARPTSPLMNARTAIWANTEHIHNPILRTLGRISGIAGTAMAESSPEFQEMANRESAANTKLMQAQHQSEITDLKLQHADELEKLREQARSALEDKKQTGASNLQGEKAEDATNLEKQKSADRPAKLNPGKIVPRKMPDGSTHEVMVDAATGQDIRDLGDAGKETRTYGRMEPVNDAQGNTLGWADTTSGRFVPFSSTGQGQAMPPKPSAQSLGMGQMAQTVLPQVQNVKGEIKHLADSIGPAAGRWNQLLVNKGGTDFPEFAGLDTDLDLLASAIVRTHFGARGGQGYREELKKQFSAAQTPEDLINRIDHADEWIKGYAKMAGTGKIAPEVKTPEVGTIRTYQGASYRFKGGDWKDKNNWVKQ